MRTIVVGASSGLGRCIAVDLARRGEPVALLARRMDRLVAAQEEAGDTSVAVRCDVTDDESARVAVEEAVAFLGGVDAVVYASAIGPLAHIADIDGDTWRQAFETNVIGASRITAAVLSHLVESRGSIAYLSSIAASAELPPRPGFAAYVVSKAGLDKLVECWRVEHPSVGFTRVVVGDCAGGEGDSQVELSAGWDETAAAEIFPVWMERGYVAGHLLDVSDLIAVVDNVLRCRGTVPSVAVTPRPAT